MMVYRKKQNRCQASLAKLGVALTLEDRRALLSIFRNLENFLKDYYYHVDCNGYDWHCNRSLNEFTHSLFSCYVRPTYLVAVTANHRNSLCYSQFSQAGIATIVTRRRYYVKQNRTEPIESYKPN